MSKKKFDEEKTDNVNALGDVTSERANEPDEKESFFAAKTPSLADVLGSCTSMVTENPKNLMEARLMLQAWYQAQHPKDRAEFVKKVRKDILTFKQLGEAFYMKIIEMTFTEG